MSINTQELEDRIRAIIKAPMRSQVSTSDIAVGMWSSTALSEKVHDLTAVIESAIQEARKEAEDAAIKISQTPCSRCGGQVEVLRSVTGKLTHRCPAVTCDGSPLVLSLTNPDTATDTKS